MTSWKQAFARAAWSGSAAAILSGVALAVCGRLERKSAAAPLNGPSQWLWGESAAWRRRASVRETVSGYVIHHAVSIGWATVHEKYAARRRDSLARDCLAAGVTAGIACFMDFAVARGRLRPGFEKHLGKRSLTVVYGAFALGLALGRETPRKASPDVWSDPSARRRAMSPSETMPTRRLSRLTTGSRRTCS
jgi:hypothetical protein